MSKYSNQEIISEIDSSGKPTIETNGDEENSGIHVLRFICNRETIMSKKIRNNFPAEEN